MGPLDGQRILITRPRHQAPKLVGRLEALGESVALPAGLATGHVRASGALSGPVRPRRHFVSELEGRVRVEDARGAAPTRRPVSSRRRRSSDG